MYKILFISVVYNNYDDTDSLCRSLLNQNRNISHRINCLIIDNSSDNDISRKILSLQYIYNFVHVLKPEKNLGYFGGLNYGIEACNCHDYSNVVVCNNDLEFDEDFCDNLLSNNYTNETLVICPDIVSAIGRHQNPHALAPISRLHRFRLDIYFLHYYIATVTKIIQKIFNSFKMPKHNSAPLKPCFMHMGIGACYILRHRFFKHFLKLEYPFFIYGEEAFLTSQVHSVGGRLFFDPSLRVMHKECASLSTLPKRVTYEYAREGYRVYRKLY